MRQIACGKDLTVTATGYNGTLTKKAKIFVRNCKCGCCIYLFNFFFQVFFLRGMFSYHKNIIC